MRCLVPLNSFTPITFLSASSQSSGLSSTSHSGSVWKIFVKDLIKHHLFSPFTLHDINGRSDEIEDRNMMWHMRWNCYVEEIAFVKLNFWLSSLG